MSTPPGFTLFVDESGDEGTEKVRPLDEDGASEYFVMAGLLIRTSRIPELNRMMESLRTELGLATDEEIHYRDLSDEGKSLVIQRIANFRVGLVAVVSNKRNMRGYRNLRVERSIMQIHRSGKQVPERYNWFYNHIFRYLMETASTECSRWAKTLTSLNPKIDVVFSHRKGFRYSQTSAYLAKLQVERRPVWYFNNRHKVDFRAADPFLIRSQRAKNDDGLQAVDCVASAIYGAIDENWLGSVVPERLSNLSPKFLRPAGRRSPAGYGFKLLPVKFDVPLTRNQKQSLHSVGYAHLT